MKEQTNVEIIEEIFTKTNEILTPIWSDEENPQISHILYYLSLLAGYLKGKEEAKKFGQYWEVKEFQNLLESGADRMDWLNQSNVINAHFRQALREESIHSPESNMNLGISKFYQRKFESLFQEAQNEYTSFQQQKDQMVKGMQQHHNDVFSSQESWEAALRRGDPTALCD